MTQVALFTKAGLSQGMHVIKVVNKGEAPVVLLHFTLQNRAW